MAITINEFSTNPRVGPGIAMDLSSDFTPFPVPGSWQITLALSAGAISPFAVFSVPTSSANQRVIPFTNFGGMSQSFFGSDTLETGANVHVTVDLKSNTGTTLDTVDTAFVYDPTWGLGQQAQLIAAGGTSLSPAQTAQLESAATNSAEIVSDWGTYTSVTLPSLQDVLNSIVSAVTATVSDGVTVASKTLAEIFSVLTLGFLTKVEVTSGPQSGLVESLINARLFGIIVEITTIPVGNFPADPWSEWYRAPLARLSIKRGGDELYGEAIHVANRMIYPVPGVWEVPFLQVAIAEPVTPPEFTISVQFAELAAGQVWIMTAP